MANVPVLPDKPSLVSVHGTDSRGLMAGIITGFGSSWDIGVRACGVSGFVSSTSYINTKGV